MRHVHAALGRCEKRKNPTNIRLLRIKSAFASDRRSTDKGHGMKYLLVATGIAFCLVQPLHAQDKDKTEETEVASTEPEPAVDGSTIKYPDGGQYTGEFVMVRLQMVRRTVSARSNMKTAASIPASGSMAGSKAKAKPNMPTA